MTSTELATDDPVARLRRAAEDREAARERLDAAGEADLRRLRERCEELRELLDRYEERATGDGDFEAFIEFQEEIDRFVSGLAADFPRREAFEDIDDRLQQRRLTERDFEAVRSRLADATSDLAPLEAWEDATERYRDARDDLEHRRYEVRERIDDLERVAGLGAADLEAPVERLRDPIAAYDDAVDEAFASFKHDRPAREVLDFVASTAAFPLVGYREPPEDLRGFVDEHAAGEEPIPTLLEYADYSLSKLEHYVDAARELKRAVATQQTYLRRLDADPLTVGWPPPAAETLRWECEERIAVVGRFAPDVVPALREVRGLTRREDYERLRESAVARAELTDGERERLRNGEIEPALADARAERERLEAALEEHPEL
ncbi:MAG: hypothetical protein ABEJ89_04425 [Haloarculaceae archaeon]